MEFQNPVLGMLAMFIPEPYQITSASFFNYVKALPEKRIQLRLHSFAVDARKGIQIIEYLGGKTDVHEMSWTQLKNSLDIDYKQKYPSSAQYEQMLLQLKNAF